MKKSQLALLAVAVIAVGLIAILGSGGGDDSGSNANGNADTPTAPKQAPAGATTVSFAYSPEKEKLLVPLVNRFNASNTQVDGKRVFVQAQDVSSGDAQTKIASGRLKLTAWSPSSSMWGRLLNFEADQPYAPDESPSIVRTPLVIAMWEPMAKALGYPKRKIGFADILKLARSNQGWAAFGHPEFGQFKLVHTNPDFSTSGLSRRRRRVLLGDRQEGGPADRRHQARAARRSRTSSARSCTTATRRCSSPTSCASAARATRRRSRWRRRRSSTSTCAAAAATSSSRSIRRRARSTPTTRSSRSTRPWVTDAQKQGAAKFAEYLAENIDGRDRRPLRLPPRRPRRQARGPAERRQRRRPEAARRACSACPQPRVLAAVKNAWREDRKPANVLLVLDTSGSMNDEGRLASAKDGLQTFLKEVAPQDRVGLTIFNDRVTEVAPITPIREIRASLRAVVVAAHRRRRHRDLRRDRRGRGDGQEARRHEPHQRRRPADRRRGHRLVEDRRVGRARARRAGRLVAPRARVHDRLLGRRRGRGGEARADRRRRRAARPTRATPTTSNRSTAASARSSSGALQVSSPARQPYSRGEFAGALVANATAKPFNIALLVGTMGAGVLLASAGVGARAARRARRLRDRRPRGRSSTRRRPTRCSRACAPSAAPR